MTIYTIGYEPSATCFLTGDEAALAESKQYCSSSTHQ
jgi:hypothetical protein